MIPWLLLHIALSAQVAAGCVTYSPQYHGYVAAPCGETSFPGKPTALENVGDCKTDGCDYRALSAQVGQPPCTFNGNMAFRGDVHTNCVQDQPAEHVIEIRTRGRLEAGPMQLEAYCEADTKENCTHFEIGCEDWHEVTKEQAQKLGFMVGNNSNYREICTKKRRVRVTKTLWIDGQRVGVIKEVGKNDY